MTKINDSETTLIVMRCYCSLDAHHYLFWPGGLAIVRMFKNQPKWYCSFDWTASVVGGAIGVGRVSPTNLQKWLATAPGWVPPHVLEAIRNEPPGAVTPEPPIYTKRALRELLQSHGVFSDEVG